VGVGEKENGRIKMKDMERNVGLECLAGDKRGVVKTRYTWQ
jgi:hypothetical protein